MKLVRTIAPVLALSSFIGFWFLICTLGWVSPYLLASPWEVFLCYFSDTRELFTAVFSTALCALAGFLASLCVGFVLGTLLALFPLFHSAFYPFAVVLQTVPIIAIAPLLVIWFGYGAPTVTVSAFIASVFPVIMATLNGLASSDDELRDLFQLYGANSRTILFKLLIPMAVPSLLTGLRISAGLAVVGAIVGEFIGGGGLGSVVDSARTQQRLDKVFAAVILASALGALAILALDMLNRMLLSRWNPRMQSQE